MAEVKTALAMSSPAIMCIHCGKITEVVRLGVPIRPVYANAAAVQYKLACGCVMTDEDAESRMLNKQLVWCAAQDHLHDHYGHTKQPPYISECPCYCCRMKHLKSPR